MFEFEVALLATMYVSCDEDGLVGCWCMSTATIVLIESV